MKINIKASIPFTLEEAQDTQITKHAHTYSSNKIVTATEVASITPHPDSSYNLIRSTCSLPPVKDCTFAQSQVNKLG